MSLHRLSAGAGYRYLLRHTACGDAVREAGTPLTAYYAASGYPPGRWAGSGLVGLGDPDRRLAAGSVVTEEQMVLLFGGGPDPLTGVPLGRAYPSFAPVEQRIAARIAALPGSLDDQSRARSVAEIEAAERDRTSPVAAAGFDLTFTLPKSGSIDAAIQAAVSDFYATHGCRPNRVEVLRLRQQATLATRPGKTPHTLGDLMNRWADTARRVTGRTPRAIAGVVLGREPERRLRHDQLNADMVAGLAAQVVAGVMERRATWNQWNVLAEAARATRGLRMASTGDRLAVVDRVHAAALELCVRLDPGDLVAVPDELRRNDGASVFSRAGEQRYSHHELLAAEERLLDAHTTLGGPVVAEATARRLAAVPQPARPDEGARVARLAADQVDAVVTIATSGRLVDVLVGPAGTGKTTTLRALRTVWESGHGRGSVIGLAPSANAAQQLAGTVGIGCETITKWLAETTGPAAGHRVALLDELTRRRGRAAAAGDRVTVRRLDGARAVLQRAQALWRLRRGQLVIVDEASLAGTLDLDALRVQAADTGAKLVLVGDHAQLSAVDAGGGFGLLARTGTPAELHSLWRFRHRWEAEATRRLRHGDPGVIDAYQAHGRLHGGPAETMTDQAYAAWLHDHRAGRSVILVAADNHTVIALNQRVHTDRVAAGEVTGPTLALGAPGCGPDRGRVGIGDTVLTRKNDRTLRVPGGGHVRNGALWTVNAVHDDGSLTITPHRTQPDRKPIRGVRLSASYVAEHVDLGYATTAHRAQGITVDCCHVLAAAGMPREAFYVAMTRGRHANTAYVASDPIDPWCDGAGAGQDPHGMRDVLVGILADTRAETSATETRARATDAGRSLNRLAPIRAAIASIIDHRRWPALLSEAVFSASDIDAITASPAAGPLFAALRRGEALGHAIHRVAAQLRSSGNRQPIADLAAVLHHRVETWLATAPDLTGQHRTPATVLGLTEPGHDPDTDPLGGMLAAVDALIDTRIEQLVQALCRSRPGWFTPSTTGVTPDSDQRGISPSPPPTQTSTAPTPLTPHRKT